MTQFVLKLYITPGSPRSEGAVANLRRLCDHALTGRCTLSIINVLEQPQLAERDKVFVTPTLIREMPPPARRIIGDLSDPAKLAEALGLSLEDP